MDINSEVLSLNKKDYSKDSFTKIEESTKPSNDFDKFFINFSTINEIDNQLDKLPCCLNEFLEKKMKTPKERFQLLELRRNKDIKIKLYSRKYDRKFVVCHYCKKEHWPKPDKLVEITINFSESISNICNCALENHDFFKQNINFDLNDEIKGEIKEIRKLCEDNISQNKDIIAKRILELIKDEKKDHDIKLKIISSLMNIGSTKEIFSQLGYKHDIYSVIFPSLVANKSKNCSSYSNIISQYLRFFFFKPIHSNEIKFLKFDYYWKKDEAILPDLYYNNPDYFSHSFYFQAYKKKIISDYLKTNKVIQFLREKKIDNDIISLDMINIESIPNDLFLYGIFSLDSIKNLNQDDLSKFKRNLRSHIFIINPIFKNHLYEIFFDFLKNGKSDHISLLNNSNDFSKLILESILDKVQNKKSNIMQVKSMLNNYLLYMQKFLDENKIRKIALLSSFSFSLVSHQNIFNDIEEKKKNNYDDINKQDEYFEKIFNKIKENVDNIIKGKTRKNDSLHNIIIVKKLLKMYEKKINYDDKFKIKELYYDFNELLQNIIEKDYPTILANKVIEILNDNNKELDTYLKYLTKIILLCCTNIIGSSYIYNSNIIPKLLMIIRKLNFSDYSEKILDMLIILKVTFNRKFIDISFLKMKNEENEMTVKEYLIDILFRNEPIISDNSMYDFKLFDRLLERMNTLYSFIFEKKNKKILLKSFDGIDCDDSYLEIIKTISKNMTELVWKKENIQTDFSTKEELIDINEQAIETIIKEKIKNINRKIPRFILLDILRCLENLNQTNFYLEYNDNSYFMDNKYDLYSIITDDKLPFSIKSLILNYLLKLVLTLKIGANNNKIYGPLIYTSRYEKEFQNIINIPKKDMNKYLITLKSDESEKHLNESVKLMSIYNVCIGILRSKKDLLNFKKAFIEKNGLYDFCVSIIQAIYCFSNLIINTNKIHELYLSAYIELASNFFKNTDLFIDIINDETIFENGKINNDKNEKKKICLNEIIKNGKNEKNGKIKNDNEKNKNKNIKNKNIKNDKNERVEGDENGIKKNKIELITENDNYHKLDYGAKISIIIEVNNIIEKLINKINLDSYNFSDNKPTSIYQSFNEYKEGKSNDHYQYIFFKENGEITLDELNEFNGIDNNPEKNPIFDNYKKWIEKINDEKVDEFFRKIFNSKNGSKTRSEIFYTHILIHLADLNSEGECILNDPLFLKSLIKIIKIDSNFKNLCNDESIEINVKEFININFSIFKARIIGNIIRKIYFLTNYELLISLSFSNTKQENILTDLLNSLILFLEILGEHFNQVFHEAIFKYKFDLRKEKDNAPVAKYDEESKTFKMLNEKDEENNSIYTPYEILIKLHQKIFETLRITNDDKYRETLQNNLLIIFNSLTYCIVEYSNFDNPVYKSFLEEIYLNYFYWKREDKSHNSLFLEINFDIDHDLINRPKKILIMNNILTLFIYYIKYGTKKRSKTYFFQNRDYYYYTPVFYYFHAFFYTFQIINSINENILKSEEKDEKLSDELIELFKKKKIHNHPLFVIAKRYYILLFLSKTYYGYKILKNILPNKEEKDININEIINYFTDNYYYLELLNKFVKVDNNLDESSTVSKIKNEYSKQMNIVFLFWRKIFITLEITINGQNRIIYCIKKPESFYFLKDERLYYENKINYSSRESKLISMYDNIDSFIFEMISNSICERFNLASIFYYSQLELINIIFFIIENIILLILFYKSWDEDYSKYNEIDNNKESIVLLILFGVHFLYLIIILINWLYNRLKIDYYYALSSNSNNILIKKNKKSLQDKAIEFRNLLIKYSRDFKKINEIFKELTDNDKRYILIMDTIILNPKVYPYLVSLICLILQFISKIFIVIPLLLIANLIPTLSAIFKGLFSKLKYLIFIYSYTLIVLYIFSWIGFLFLPHLFKFEVVNKRNELIVNQNLEVVEEYVCSSSIQCILYFLNFGLSSGGSLDLNLISFKNNYGYYLRQFFFDMFFFLFINMIFSNVFLALITDAFAEMRELAWKNEDDKANVCFICGLTKSECIYQNKDFNTHIEEHSKWNYIDYMCKLILEDDVDFNKEQHYIWELMKMKNIDWFPKKLEDKEDKE